MSEARNPFASAVMAEQDAALERLFKLTSREPDYLADQDQIMRELWQIGSVARLAIESAARRRPRFVVGNTHTNIEAGRLEFSGEQAYVEWMITDWSDRRASASLRVQPVYEGHKAVEFDAGGFNRGLIAIAQTDSRFNAVNFNIAEPLHQPMITLLTIYDSYGQPYNEATEEKICDKFSDSVVSLDGEELYSHTPLGSNGKIGSIEDIRERLGEHAAEIYTDYDELGLARLRLHELCKWWRAGLNLG